MEKATAWDLSLHRWVEKRGPCKPDMVVMGVKVRRRIVIRYACTRYDRKGGMIKRWHDPMHGQHWFVRTDRLKLMRRVFLTVHIRLRNWSRYSFCLDIVPKNYWRWCVIQKMNPAHEFLNTKKHVLIGKTVTTYEITLWHLVYRLKIVANGFFFWRILLRKGGNSNTETNDKELISRAHAIRLFCRDS